MQNQLFDLKPGQSLFLGDYKVTFLHVEDESAVLEIDGPEGCVRLEPQGLVCVQVEEEVPVLV